MGGNIQNGIFYGNSKTRHIDIHDGSSNTILIGEKSSSIFNSAWSGVIGGADFSAWRVVGWTGEPPNYKPPTQEDAIHFHRFAQFHSSHPGGLAMFAFADGSVTTLSTTIDFEVFHSLGTINGREKETNEDFR